MSNADDEATVMGLLSVGITIIAEGFVTHHAPCVPWCDVCYPLCECGVNHPKGHHEVATSQVTYSTPVDFKPATHIMRFESGE